jgi:hypothetical protein
MRGLTPIEIQIVCAKSGEEFPIEDGERLIKEGRVRITSEEVGGYRYEVTAEGREALRLQQLLSTHEGWL